MTGEPITWPAFTEVLDRFKRGAVALAVEADTAAEAFTAGLILGALRELEERARAEIFSTLPPAPPVASSEEAP